VFDANTAVMKARAKAKAKAREEARAKSRAEAEADADDEDDIDGDDDDYYDDDDDQGGGGDEDAADAGDAADTDQYEVNMPVVGDTSTVTQTICGRDVAVQKLIADVEFMALVDRYVYARRL